MEESGRAQLTNRPNYPVDKHLQLPSTMCSCEKSNVKTAKVTATLHRVQSTKLADKKNRAACQKRTDLLRVTTVIIA